MELTDVQKGTSSVIIKRRLFRENKRKRKQERGKEESLKRDGEKYKEINPKKIFVFDEKNKGLGTEILQHDAPLVKSMLMASNPDIDYMTSIRYVQREYHRTRNKVINKTNPFLLRLNLDILSYTPVNRKFSTVYAPYLKFIAFKFSHLNHFHQY